MDTHSVGLAFVDAPSWMLTVIAGISLLAVVFATWQEHKDNHR